MKITHLRFRHQNNSGIILVVVLWFLVILTTLAIGLGRRTSIDLALTQHALGKTKSYYAAWGGLIYCMNQIGTDAQDPTTATFDTLYQLAIKLDEKQTVEDLFKEIPLGEGLFTVGREVKDEISGTNSFRYGLSDEESKININAITMQDYKIFDYLLMIQGVDPETAHKITFSVIDWKDADNIPLDSVYGAEDEYYMGLSKPYRCKNKPFDSLEELMLVKGMTPEIFSQLKDSITIFPKEATSLSVNVNTASGPVLRALFLSFSGPATNTDASDADSLTAKVISFRRGPDNKKATPDDRKVESNELGLNTAENAIYLTSQGRLVNSSSYIHARVRGFDKASEARTEMDAVIFRNDFTIVDWHHN